MAKSKHNHLLDTISELILDAQKNGLVHLYTEGPHTNGRHLTIKGRELRHFGTTSYLGLDQDPRLKEAAIQAIQQYGTQFPMSKTYVSFGLCQELEDCLRAMYQRPVAISKNSTLAHIGLIPSLIRDEDALILDQQVHASVQNAAQLLKPRGITVQLVKHSNMTMLENMILRLRDTHRRIWYAADGIYSMFGDTVPLAELMQLAKKYPQLHLYLDDVHGMSWAGQHGTGYVMDQLKELPDRTVLIGTLGKSFGASGAVAVFSSEELYESYRVFGGPQTFSVQADPASVAAALASARIHLSDEIHELQQDLAAKIAYCNQLIGQTNLPLVKQNACPVHFIAAGVPAIAYNLARRLINDGFYVNVATFPVVPARNAGVRFSISRHNTREDIRALVDAMAKHYPEVLKEEGHTLNQVRSAFQLPAVDDVPEMLQTEGPLSVQIEQSIRQIDRTTWNQCFGERGAMDWDALCMYEQAFTGNEQPEHNWQFVYLIMRDRQQQVVLATFFTVALWKDDMLAPASVSQQVEALRQTDPTYLMSRTLGMGTLVTDGEYLYADKRHEYYFEALKLLSVEIEELKEAYHCTAVSLRDIDAQARDFSDIFYPQGYFRVDLPATCVVEKMPWQDVDSYLRYLPYKSRYHVRKDAVKMAHHFDVTVKETMSTAEVMRTYELYKNVSDKNFALNNIEFPYTLFECMNNDSRWEFIQIRLKPKYVASGDNPLVGVVCCYRTDESYCAVILGMDYTYVKDFKLYKQALFQMVMRGHELGKERVYLGMTAAQEKKKYGAIPKARVAYGQAQDNYKLELIESMVGTTA